MKLESNSFEKNHKHFQRRCIPLLASLNNVPSHFAPSPDYSAVISSWPFPFQVQVFHLKGGKLKVKISGHIHICILESTALDKFLEHLNKNRYVINCGHRGLMTIRHFTFLESFYDILEFTSKLKQQEKQEKLKKLKKENHVTITEKRVTIWRSQETCIRHW